MLEIFRKKQKSAGNYSLQLQHFQRKEEDRGAEGGSQLELN
jgi:hypothetical protein